jgi:hypothetical protein
MQRRLLWCSEASFSKWTDTRGLGLLAKRLTGIGALEADPSPLRSSWWVGLMSSPEWHDGR